MNINSLFRISDAMYEIDLDFAKVVAVVARFCQGCGSLPQLWLG